MRSPNADREGRGIPAPARRITRRGTAHWGLAAGLLVLLGAVLAGQHPTVSAGTGQDVAYDRSSAPPGDLRCLTRRPEDCLARPVPLDEPHGANCATCHSLWERGGPGVGTIRSCIEAECHTGAESLTPFHATVGETTLADCTSCHLPHAFRVTERGARCSDCHQGGGRAAIQARGRPARRLARELPFRHDEHTGLTCTSCHDSRDRHGALMVADPADCRACHHGSAVTDDCVQCHARGEMDSLSLVVTRTLDIRIGLVVRPSRTFIFEHARHTTATCTTCHTGPGLEALVSADCSSCHFEHHEPASDCSACHERPSEGAHDRRSHLGCGGLGCHDPVPPGIEGAPRTRQLCLACHTEQVDHKPGRNCADCHVLPPLVATRRGL